MVDFAPVVCEEEVIALAQLPLCLERLEVGLELLHRHDRDSTGQIFGPCQLLVLLLRVPDFVRQMLVVSGGGSRRSETSSSGGDDDGDDGAAVLVAVVMLVVVVVVEVVVMLVGSSRQR